MQNAALAQDKEFLSLRHDSPFLALLDLVAIWPAEVEVSYLKINHSNTLHKNAALQLFTYVFNKVWNFQSVLNL